MATIHLNCLQLSPFLIGKGEVQRNPDQRGKYPPVPDQHRKKAYRPWSAREKSLPSLSSAGKRPTVSKQRGKKAYRPWSAWEKSLPSLSSAEKALLSLAAREKGLPSLISEGQGLRSSDWLELTAQCSLTMSKDIHKLSKVELSSVLKVGSVIICSSTAILLTREQVERVLGS